MLYLSLTLLLVWRGVVCGTAAGEGWSSGFGVWCQRKTNTADFHRIITSSLLELDARTCVLRAACAALEIDSCKDAQPKSLEKL